MHAVTIALPLLKQPGVITKALKSGKHVLSEKPIAKDTKTAEKLLAEYEALDETALWTVGESYRFMEPILWAFRKLKDDGGNVETFSVKLHTSVDGEEKLYRAR